MNCSRSSLCVWVGGRRECHSNQPHTKTPDMGVWVSGYNLGIKQTVHIHPESYTPTHLKNCVCHVYRGVDCVGLFFGHLASQVLQWIRLPMATMRAISSGLHSSRLSERTREMCEPSCRWTPEHSMHSRQPWFSEAHSGSVGGGVGGGAGGGT